MGRTLRKISLFVGNLAFVIFNFLAIKEILIIDLWDRKCLVSPGEATNNLFDSLNSVNFRLQKSINQSSLQYQRWSASTGAYLVQQPRPLTNPPPPSCPHSAAEIKAVEQHNEQVMAEIRRQVEKYIQENKPRATEPPTTTTTTLATAAKTTTMATTTTTATTTTAQFVSVETAKQIVNESHASVQSKPHVNEKMAEPTSTSSPLTLPASLKSAEPFVHIKPKKPEIHELKKVIKQKVEYRAEWMSCLAKIQEDIHETFSPAFGFLGQGGPVSNKGFLLIDPAYHGNVGDSLNMGFGEHLLFSRFGMPMGHVHECGISQSQGRNEWCQDKFDKYGHQDISTGIFHGGNNWGDLWDYQLQLSRVNSIHTLLTFGFRFVSAPQSMHYVNKTLEHRDARIIEHGINRTIGYEHGPEKVFFSWPEVDSYHRAQQLYPFVTNLLTPNLAFMNGPGLADQRWPTYSTGLRTGVPPYDIIFLLRTDKMTQFAHQDIHGLIKSGLVSKHRPEIRYMIADWGDMFNYYHVKTPEILNNMVFDYMGKDEATIAFLSLGKVIVTDQDHGAIYSLLHYIPTVILNSNFGKIEKQMNVAFRNKAECQNKHKMRYDYANGINQGVDKALEFIDTYKL